MEQIKKANSQDVLTTSEMVNNLSTSENVEIDHSSKIADPNSMLKGALKQSPESYKDGEWVFDAEKLKHIGELIEEALSKGANPNDVINTDELYNLNLVSLAKYKELFTNHPVNPLNPDVLLEIALKQNSKSYKDGEWVFDAERLKHIGGLIEEALTKGAKPNDVITPHEGLSIISIAEYKELLTNHPVNPLTAENLFRVVIQKYEEDGELSINQRKAAEEALSYAFDMGLDVNAKFDPEEEGIFNLTIFEIFFITNKFEIVDKLFKPDLKIGSVAWAEGISSNPGIEFVVEAIKRFPNSFSAEELYTIARANGASNSDVQSIVDVYNLAKDYLETINANSNLLSKEELSLLDKEREALSVEAYKDINVQNKYGFTPLQLALFGNKIELAVEMVKHGHSLTEKSVNGTTALQIIGQLVEEKAISAEAAEMLNELMMSSLDNVDVILNDVGESLIDGFISNEKFRDEIISRSEDPLFKFFKKDADLFEPSTHPELTHIAISHGEGFWSSGIWAWARLATKEHPGVQFHLVDLKMIEQGGDAFVKQFDGWINPGGGDDYPKSKKEFSKADWESQMLLIKTYQEVLAKTFEFKIPYMGMCAGAQNIVLYHEGHLQPVKGYLGGDHTVTYLKGTLPHFMAMTKDQQKAALKYCELPEISFKGDTAHKYAAVSYKLGDGMELGAISEDGVAMSYAHINGLRYATQFHPEHHFHVVNDTAINHEKEWLSNFINLTIMHHEYRDGEHEHPEVFFQYINERLKQCVEAPTSMLEDSFVFGNATVDSTIFG